MCINDSGQDCFHKRQIMIVYMDFCIFFYDV